MKWNTEVVLGLNPIYIFIEILSREIKYAWRKPERRRSRTKQHLEVLRLCVYKPLFTWRHVRHIIESRALLVFVGV